MERLAHACMHLLHSCLPDHPPTCLPAYQPDGSLTRYTGKDDALLLSEWMQGFYAAAAPSSGSSSGSGSDSGSSGNRRSGRQWVQRLPSAEFSEKVMEREEMWVVALTDSSGEAVGGGRGEEGREEREVGGESREGCKEMSADW